MFVFLAMLQQFAKQPRLLDFFFLGSSTSLLLSKSLRLMMLLVYDESISSVALIRPRLENLSFVVLFAM